MDVVIVLHGMILAFVCQVFGKLYGKTDRMQETTWKENLLDTVGNRSSLVECGANCESLPSCNAFRFKKGANKGWLNKFPQQKT